jgi:hypothetical protein
MNFLSTPFLLPLSSPLNVWFGVQPPNLTATLQCSPRHGASHAFSFHSSSTHRVRPSSSLTPTSQHGPSATSPKTPNSASTMSLPSRENKLRSESSAWPSSSTHLFSKQPPLQLGCHCPGPMPGHVPLPRTRLWPFCHQLGSNLGPLLPQPNPFKGHLKHLTSVLIYLFHFLTWIYQFI